MKEEVLVIVDSICNGGIEKVVYNIAKFCCEEITFHIYVINQKDMYYATALKECGCIIVNESHNQITIPSRFHLFSSVNMYLSRNTQIKCIHIHSANHAPECLLAAWVRKLPVRCIHSHNAYSTYWNPELFSFKVRLCSLLFKYINNLLSTHRIACSKAAAITSFGKQSTYSVIFNGIDLAYFSPSSHPAKEELQRKYGLKESDDNFIFVGRFAEQKNCIFMLRVIAHILKTQNNIHLSIVGYGELEKDIKDTIIQLGLQSYVKFFPHHSNIPELLKASDYFISPSLHEGLGLVFVEAQLMGLNAFASDQVPTEADIGLCHFVPLSLKVPGYAEYVKKVITSKTSHIENRTNIARAYDMAKIAEIYKKIYKQV